MQLISMRSNAIPQFLHLECAQYRYRVFCEKLGWELEAVGASNGLELDQFDRPDTVYVIAKNEYNEICGHARLLPTIRPYLIGEVFPELLNGIEIPSCETIWELSRFAALDTSDREIRFNPEVSKLLLKEAAQYVKQQGADRLISASPVGVERLIHRAGYKAYRAGPPVMIDNKPIIACWIEL